MHPIINNKITAKTQQDKFINIYREIDRLIQYAVLTELIQDIDIIYTRNRTDNYKLFFGFNSSLLSFNF